MTEALTMWSSADSQPPPPIGLSFCLSLYTCAGLCSYIRIHTDSWDMFVCAKERGSVTMTMALETNLTSNSVCIFVSSCCVFFLSELCVCVGVLLHLLLLELN